MSIEKTAPEPIQEMLQHLEGGRFQFDCHPGVPCFTECCRDLKLMLTPYDILRLKRHLGLTAGEFLDAYTDTQFDEHRKIPMVYLNMQENERKTCPFVSPKGCLVYADRPSACRIYPVARASRMHRVHGTVQEDYFLLHESHCRGFEEDRTWETGEWLSDQGLDPYHEMNNLWMQIITHPKVIQGISARQQQMFFLAGYNLERFREFVTQSRFLQAFEVADEEVAAIRKDDEALLKLAFKWLSFSLLNEPVLKLRQGG